MPPCGAEKGSNFGNRDPGISLGQHLFSLFVITETICVLDPEQFKIKPGEQVNLSGQPQGMGCFPMKITGLAVSVEIAVHCTCLQMVTPQLLRSMSRNPIFLLPFLCSQPRQLT